MTFISSPEKKQWLLDVHLKGITVLPFACATLVGPEDAPQCIVLYPTRNFRSLPVVYVRGENGDYRLEDDGQGSEQ